MPTLLLLLGLHFGVVDQFDAHRWIAQEMRRPADDRLVDGLLGRIDLPLRGIESARVFLVGASGARELRLSLEADAEGRLSRCTSYEMDQTPELEEERTYSNSRVVTRKLTEHGTHPAVTTVTYTYDQEGRIISSTWRKGGQDVFLGTCRYPAPHQALVETVEASAQGELRRACRYEYGDDGLIRRRWRSADGAQFVLHDECEYDERGRIVRIWMRNQFTGDCYSKHYEYAEQSGEWGTETIRDVEGRLVSNSVLHVSPDGARRRDSWDYTKNGRVEEHTDGIERSTSAEYSDRSMPVRITQVRSGGRSFQETLYAYDYDEGNRLIGRRTVQCSFPPLRVLEGHAYRIEIRLR